MTPNDNTNSAPRALSQPFIDYLNALRAKYRQLGDTNFNSQFRDAVADAWHANLVNGTAIDNAFEKAMDYQFRLYDKRRVLPSMPASVRQNFASDFELESAEWMLVAMASTQAYSEHVNRHASEPDDKPTIWLGEYRRGRSMFEE